MALLRAEGVVLRLRDLGDTSRIVTVYTREQGKFAVVAKGARTPKSRFGAALMPGAHVRVVFYQRETRDLRFLSQADLLEPYGLTGADLEALTYASAVCEFLDAVIAGEESHPDLFELALAMLRGLAPPDALAVRDAPEARRPASLLAFELQAAVHLGLKPELESCVACRRSVDGSARFAARRGGLLCPACGEREMESFAISRAAIDALRALLVAPVGAAPAVRRGVADEVETALEVFLRCHVPHYAGLRSRELLKRLEGAPGA